MATTKVLKDIQDMDNNYARYYFVPWPVCQEFEELDDIGEHVIPVVTADMTGDFVEAEWIAKNYD